MTRSPRAVLALVIAGVVAAAACSGDGGRAGEPIVATTPTTATMPTSANDTDDLGADSPVTSSSPATVSAPTSSSSASTSAPIPLPPASPLVAARPVEVIVPAGLSPATPAPLVVVLHGYTGTAAAQAAYFGFTDEAANRGMLLAHPDGTVDARGAQFWNAFDACCDFFGSEVDDVAYLAAVIDHADRVHPVDRDRVFLAGHSNGGFMSYRFACERADLVAAVVSLAGTMDDDTSGCRPSTAVSVAQVHGTLDDVIRYDGGTFLAGPYASVPTTIETWAALNGCVGGDPLVEPPVRDLDLDERVVGAETTVRTVSGCPPDGAVEVWTIDGGSHLPALGRSFAAEVFDFFEAHGRG